MTSNGFHDTGEEWLYKWAFRQDAAGSRGASLSVLLFSDSTDGLSDSSDIGDITTEPTNGDYARENVSLDSNNISLSVFNGNIRMSGSVEFQTTNTTGNVDSWAVVVNFPSTVFNSESSANDHLLSSATMGTVDLSNKDTVGVTFSTRQD